MIDNFLLLKLNRTVWVSLLAQDDILEAIRYYELYMNNLTMFTSDKKLKKQVEEEMAFSTSFFLNKMGQKAKSYYEEKDYANAAICYTSMFKYVQQDVEIIENYYYCLNHLEQYSMAAELVSYMETLAPNNYKIYKMLAEVYDKKDDNYKSVECYEKYLELKGASPDANDHNFLGCYYNKLFSSDTRSPVHLLKSLDSFKNASDLAPYVKLYAKNVTIMAAKAEDYETGKKYWDRILQMDILNNDDKYDYAAFCLKHEDFEGWHKYFGARFQKEHNATRFPKINKPEWNGVKDISKSTLLVYYEQGFGDTFLMWGYISRLTKLAKHVIFVVQDSVYELFRENPYGVEVYPECLADLKKLKFDCYIPSMSIPVALKLNRENISVGGGYIQASEEIKDEFKAKYFDNKKLKIGISFSGNSSGNKTRDISIDKFLPLDKLENVEIYCLTKDVEDSKFEGFKNNKVINIAKEFKDFADTAAVIDCLDLVITSDNCILNLAGGLGKKTFGLFNWQTEFRWFDLTGEDVVWYTTVKPFVNKAIDSWDDTIQEVVEEVKKLQPVAK